MNPFTLFTATVTGHQTNTSYPNQAEITSVSDLEKAATLDHVAATYTNGQRSNTNFTVSDCVVMDVDNDHSDDPDAWVSPASLARVLPAVSFFTATSRNHMKPKGERSARPRFHVYFPITPVTCPNAYGLLKKRLAARLPFFDKAALDAGRFIYGTFAPQVTSHDGNQLIDAWLDEADDKDLFAAFDQSTLMIGEGSRNATLSRFAARVLVRYGVSEQARELFDNKANRCEPPLSTSELEIIWSSACKFAKKVAANPDYVNPDVYAQFDRVRPDDFTDVGQATVMAAMYADRARFSSATKWLAYHEGAWHESEQKARAVAQDLTSRQLAQARKNLADTSVRLADSGAEKVLSENTKLKALAEFDDTQEQAYIAHEDAKGYYGFVLKRRDSNKITACLREAEPLLEIDPQHLDTHPYLLNTPSATYDLRVGLSSKRVPDPKDLITKQTMVAPNIEGQQLWLDAIDTIFQGDLELIDYVQRICGMAVIGKVMIEALIIAYGDGSNGKSTFWNTIAKVLGSYADSISAEVLIAGKKSNAKNDMAETRGKRLLIAAETEEGRRLSTSATKQLASTDKIAAEKKYKDPFSFTPTHSLVLYTNHLPKVGAMDCGIWRRLIVVPFEAKIEGRNDIKNYAEHLCCHAGGAVLTWIMEGARLIHAENYRLNPPKCVTTATEHYRQANNWFAHFLEACCQTHPEMQCPSGALYQAYRAWAVSSGEYVRSTSDFYTALRQAGLTRRRTNQGSVVSGLQLLNEF